MPTSELISVSEYLHTAYSPDCDYVDGLVMERNVGEKDHSKIQIKFGAYLFDRGEQWNICVFPEQRVQVKPTRFRVPDLCVVVGLEPDEQIFTTPPFICIEILSRDDRMSQMQDKIEDYLSFGVPYVWILDPFKRKAYRCTADGILEVNELRTEKPDLLIPLDAVFA
jgi:Uma2 family endonuclease